MDHFSEEPACRVEVSPSTRGGTCFCPPVLWARPFLLSSYQLVGLGFKLPEGSKIYAPFKGLYEGAQAIFFM